MTPEPFAIHITWSCYGTRLPGDERGSVSNVLQPDDSYIQRPNVYGTPPAEGDSDARARAKSLQKHETAWLHREQAICVAKSVIGATATRGWWVLRAAVMANHTHVLVGGCPQDGPAVRRILKGVSQAALSKQNGSPRRWWTEAGSDRYKFDELAIEEAADYIARQEGMMAGVDDMRPFVVETDGSLRYL